MEARNKEEEEGHDLTFAIAYRTYSGTAPVNFAKNLTSDMQGVWGEPERGSAQNGISKCAGDDSSHDSISSVSIASVYGTESC